MNYLKLTKEQFNELLNERLTFSYFDGEYWYVLATLDNKDENKNDAIHYKLRICFTKKERRTLIFFDQDKLKDIISNIDIIDVSILTIKEEDAITNYKD